MKGDISHYRILGPLGEGAMGEVYKAVNQRLGREVALKMLPLDVQADADWQTRLLREAQAASALHHPGIVTLFDIASADGRSFLVLELVTGERFSDLAARGVPWAKAFELVASVAEALAAAHALGILHRDIKSDNLMVTAKGQTKVLDFGLAKLRGDLVREPGAPVAAPTEAIAIAATLHRPDRKALSSDLTQAGDLVGTPAYMAPECYEGAADARSEVFALGVVLYELVVGRRPFDRPDAMATIAAIQLDEPEPPSKAAPDREIPAEVDEIVARALAKKPEARIADMLTFAAELRAIARPPVVRSRRPWIAAAVVGALGVAALAWWIFGRSTPAKAVRIDVTASRRLTLDTGCEEYPHFTPDGATVVYDGVIDGDYEILAVPADGGARRRLTTAPGWDYAAAVSPDGQRVAYVHEAPDARTVRVIGIDGGEPHDLGTISGYPSWSDDGALLVGDNDGKILRRDPDTGAATTLGQVPAGGRPYHIVDVAGAGVAILWWTSSETDATGLGELARDGTLRVIEQGLTDYEGGLAPSHAQRGYYATRKAATTGNELYWRPWGGGAPVVVPGGLSPRAGVDVARDGHRLVFSTCTESQYIARLSPGAAPAVISRGEWQDAGPSVVDAHRLLITSNRLGHEQGWLLDLDGGEPRAVTPADALGAAPSRDGAQVVYAAEGGRGGLAVVAIAGGAPRSLTQDPSDATPVFSRDGAHVVFDRTDASGVPHLEVVATAGGAPRDLGPGESPATSPTDDTIAFVTAADAAGTRRVMLTDLAGATPRPLPGLDAASWLHPRFSADGRRLLVVGGSQQIVEVPLDGSAPPAVIWTAATNSVLSADFAADGSVIAALGEYDGDVWLAEGVFP